jgi:ribosome maturation factor RimP
MTVDREGRALTTAPISRKVGAELEIEFPGAYNLEVSSPGLDRRLVRQADYERFRGRTARIALRSPLEGRRNFQGVLEGLEGETILLRGEQEALYKLPFSAVERANLVPEI